MAYAKMEKGNYRKFKKELLEKKKAQREEN